MKTKKTVYIGRHEVCRKIRKKKIITSFIASLLVICMIPGYALAAEYNVGTETEICDSWTDASLNQDSENSFNFTNSIEMTSDGYLGVDAGKTYIINTNGYDFVEPKFSGPALVENDGAVIINGDISGNDNTSLVVNGGIDVTVNGDVELNSDAENGRNHAVEAGQGANVVVNGDVISDENGVLVFESEITINGDMSNSGEFWTENDGIHSTGLSNVISNSSLTINGDVNGHILLDGDSKLEIDGDITSTLPGPTLDLGLGEDDASSAVVTGEVSKKLEGEYNGGAAINANGSTTATVGSVTVYTNDIWTSGTAVNATGDSTIIVKGDVDGAVVTGDYAYVEIQGEHKNQGNSSENEPEDDNVADGSSSQSGGVTGGGSEGWYNPEYSYTNSETTVFQDKIVSLCNEAKEQGASSAVRQQIYRLRELNGKANDAFLADFGVDDALVMSLFDYKDILTEQAKQLLEPEYEKNSHAYTIVVYKAALAEAMDSACDVSLPTAYKVADKTQSLISKIHSYKTNGIKEGLSDTQISYLKSSLKDDILSEKEALEFLKLSGENDNVSVTAKQVVNGYEHFKTLDDAIKVSGKVFDIVEYTELSGEFIAYWAKNFSDQELMLDYLVSDPAIDGELLIAAKELKREYEDKLNGTFSKIVDEALSKGMGEAVKLFPPFAIADTVVSLTGLVTGISSKVGAMQTCLAMPGLCKDTLIVHEKAIDRINNGNTDDEAAIRVQLSYDLAKKSLETYYKAMLKLAETEEDKDNYNKVLAELERMSFGYTARVF